jgi:hypothetical protein
MAFVLVFAMLLTAVGVAHVMARISDSLVTVLIAKVVEDEAMCGAWHRYIRLAVYVVAIAGGIEVYRLEKAFTTADIGAAELLFETLRVARDAAIDVVWLLLPVFLAALVIMELRKTFGRRDEQDETAE